jgi:glycosyltransferase involved in cell wall biosynthesis
MKSYIKKVVLSILNQSFQNFEIIIVNDHSNDTTLAEIKKLQIEDSRIKLLYPPNSSLY